MWVITTWAEVCALGGRCQRNITGMFTLLLCPCLQTSVMEA